MFPDQPPLADVAYEIIHIQMAREGYPLMLHGPDTVGVTNSLLDLEVDRRVAAVGIDPYLMPVMRQHLNVLGDSTVGVPRALVEAVTSDPDIRVDRSAWRPVSG